MTNLDSVFKSRDITLPTKVRLVKAMVFPVVMYACESWTVKKAERQRIDAFELWLLEKTIALTKWTFLDKVMSLFFNMLSRLVITVLPRSKHLLISWLLITICSDFGAPQK